jgi:hypothetical protein
MSADITFEAASTYARYTQAAGRQHVAMSVMKTQAEGEAALATILLEQAAQIAAAAYDRNGRAVAGDQPTLDARA